MGRNTFKISEFQNSISSILKLLTQTIGQIDMLDAELLIAHVLKQDRTFVVAHPEKKIGRFENWRFRQLVQKRNAGTPLAYLIGQKEFYGLNFFVNRHTLIPRPETEMLVDLVINKFQISDFRFQNTMLIDVGTGSGCIPISITVNLHSTIKNLQSYAIDISRRALRVAKKNAKKHGVDIAFLHGNLLEPITTQRSPISNPRRYGRDKLQSPIIITANLPYLTEEQYKNSSTPEIHSEPKSALVASDDGLSLYKKLISQINRFSVSHSILPVTCFFEIDPSQPTILFTYIHGIFPNARIEIKKDLAGRDRVLVLSFDKLKTPRSPVD